MQHLYISKNLSTFIKGGDMLFGRGLVYHSEFFKLNLLKDGRC